mgnify:CR=1 FL=1
MNGRSSARWVVLLLCGAGLLSLVLRRSGRDELPLGRDDHLWRLSYEIDFKASAAGARLRVAVPNGGLHSRVFREDIRYTGLRAERLQKMASTRELSVTTLRGGQFRLEARFDVHLSPRARFREPASASQLTADQRAAYLRGSRTVPINSAVVRERLQYLQQEAPGKKALLGAIFRYCHEQIAADQQGPVDAKTALEESRAAPLGRALAMVALCRAAKFPARLVAGFLLQESLSAAPHFWVEVESGGLWLPYDPEYGYAGQLPADYLPVRLDGIEIVRPGWGVEEFAARYALTAISPHGGAPARRGETLLDILDLTSLPVEIHEVLTLLLLIPLGALVTAVFRTLVGIGTFGTFSPVLLAISFVYADWRTGLLVLGVVFGLGLASRAMLERLKLLLVPRLSVVLTLVVMSIVFAVSVLDYFRLTPGPEAVLLPMVILTMTIERFYLVAEEDGPGYALRTLAGTLMVGACCYLVLQGQAVGRLLLAYPELHFFTVAALVLVGRYTGYRLTELWRFRDFPVETPNQPLPA